MKKNTRLKLMSGVLATVMIASGLTACSINHSSYTDSSSYFSSLSEDENKDVSKKEKDKNNNKAAVIINSNHALVLLDNYIDLNYAYGSTYYRYDKDRFFGNVSEITYHDQDMLESKIKVLIGEDGVITYGEDYPKTSGNNKAAVVINDDNALVFLEDYINLNYAYGSTYFKYDKDRFYGNISEITYKDQDMLESKIKVLIGEDGTITYQEDYAKLK